MPYPIDSIVIGLIQALAIGFLIGAERESRGMDAARAAAPGLRDFIFIAISGSVAGFLESVPITAISFAAMVVIIAVRRIKDRTEHGITTELAALLTFWLGFMTQQSDLGLLALGVAVGVTIILMVKAPVTHLVRDVISKVEFYDTVKFLAIVFIVYPLLPEGEYGPYGFFAPRTIWKFVILVSSVSYVGYFLTRFLGGSRGLLLTGIMGAVASTTATTTAFAEGAREEPERWREYAWAAIISNAVQFPRVAVIIYAMNQEMALRALRPLMAMFAAGLVIGWWVARRVRRTGPEGAAGARPILRNPFSLRPALQFGLIFTVILFISKVAAARFGASGALTSSLVAGLIDVDAISISLANLVKQGQLGMAAGLLSVLAALLANAVFKTGFGFAAGGTRFGRTLLLAFLGMFAVGLGVIVLVAA